jgi:hypothetical protein
MGFHGATFTFIMRLGRSPARWLRGLPQTPIRFAAPGWSEPVWQELPAEIQRLSWRTVSSTIAIAL